MADSGQNLTGVWQGVYSYPFGRVATPFVATLIEADGPFSGTAHEQVPEHGSELLFSTLSGHRQGRRVGFRKEYATVAGSDYKKVDYSGTMSADGTRIEGHWTIRNEWSGKFVMTRPPRAEVAVTRTVAEPV